jgi:hypothetical protein
MVLIEYHLGLRQAVMALMNWAIDVPQKLLQSDANLFLPFLGNIYLINILFKWENKNELIIKES